MSVKMICLVIIIFLVSVAGFAQEKAKFTSINMAGTASGKSGGYGILQTVNGVRYKEWFLGIGVGIDYYKNKTIPLFADARTFIARTNFFIFGDFGYNIPFHNKPGKEVYYYDTYDFFGGSYSEFGLGYKMRLARQNSLLITSGYSYKKVNNKVGVLSPCGVPPCPLRYDTYEFGYGRILFKAGISL